jgi:hypothetical protein
MRMIGHQRPGNESVAIPGIIDDSSFFDSSNHDMMQDTG